MLSHLYCSLGIEYRLLAVDEEIVEFDRVNAEFSVRCVNEQCEYCIFTRQLLAGLQLGEYLEFACLLVHIPAHTEFVAAALYGIKIDTAAAAVVEFALDMVDRSALRVYPYLDRHTLTRLGSR